MSAESFTYDVFLSHSAKGKQAVPVPNAVRPLAERLHAEAKVRRKKEEMEFQPTAFILQPFFAGSLARFLYINWRSVEREEGCAQDIKCQATPAPGFQNTSGIEAGVRSYLRIPWNRN